MTGSRDAFISFCRASDLAFERSVGWYKIIWFEDHLRNGKGHFNVLMIYIYSWRVENVLLVFKRGVSVESYQTMCNLNL